METQDWKERLIRERTELINKIVLLKNFIDDPTVKLAKEEWRILEEQLYSMKGYLRSLTRRCRFYKLIDVTEEDCYE